MDQPVTLEVLLWVIGLLSPVFAGSFWFNIRSRATVYKTINRLSVKMAEDYATNDSVKEMERRLTERLQRIESKLDAANGRDRR